MLFHIAFSLVTFTLHLCISVFNFAVGFWSGGGLVKGAVGWRRASTYGRRVNAFWRVCGWWKLGVLLLDRRHHPGPRRCPEGGGLTQRPKENYILGSVQTFETSDSFCCSLRFVLHFHYSNYANLQSSQVTNFWFIQSGRGISEWQRLALVTQVNMSCPHRIDCQHAPRARMR